MQMYRTYGGRARFDLRALIYACHVAETIDAHSDVDPVAQHAALVAANIVVNMRKVSPGSENASIPEMKRFVDWMTKQLDALATDPTAASSPMHTPLVQLVEFLKVVPKKSTIGLGIMYARRNSAGSEVQNAYCPWKKALETALPGIFDELPSDLVIECVEQTETSD
jgi:hypothetical protein